MKQVERWQWIIDSETPPGRRVKTRWKMSETDAQAYARRNPVKVENTREVIDLPGDAGRGVAGKGALQAVSVVPRLNRHTNNSCVPLCPYYTLVIKRRER